MVVDKPRLANHTFYRSQVMTIYSRREIARGIASIPFSSSATGGDDAMLLDLCRVFEKVADMHDTCDLSNMEAEKVYQYLDKLERDIGRLQAKTFAGVVAKASVAVWTRVGDLDPENEVTAERRLSISILRDIIRLYSTKREWAP
jgi:hypothetical protein